MIRIHRLSLLVIALLLSALIGPPAHAQPIESSVGAYPLPAIVGMSGEEPFSEVATIVEHNSVDFKGTVFFEVRFKGEAVTVSGDGLTKFVKALRAHTKVRITIEPYQLQEITR